MAKRRALGIACHVCHKAITAGSYVSTIGVVGTDRSFKVHRKCGRAFMASAKRIHFAGGITPPAPVRPKRPSGNPGIFSGACAYAVGPLCACRCHGAGHRAGAAHPNPCAACVKRSRTVRRNFSGAKRDKWRRTFGRHLNTMAVQAAASKRADKKHAERMAAVQRARLETKEEILFRPACRHTKTGRYHACAASILKGKARTNPTEVYPEVVEVLARKSNGQLYKHKFNRGSAIEGLADGRLVIG